MIVHTVIESIGGESFTVVGHDPTVPGYTYYEAWFDNRADAEHNAAICNERDKHINIILTLWGE